MIDFIKVWYKDANELGKSLDDNKHFPEVFQKFEIHSGLVLPNKQAWINTIEVGTQKNGGYVKNSLHKMHNYLISKRSNNYNDFTYSNLINTIESIKKALPTLGEKHLTQLEFGFNIETTKPSSKIIESNILLHKELGAAKEDFYGKGTLKRFKHNRYQIKVYDKAKQYGLSQNILRFEIKFTNRKEFNPLGIHTLNDLHDKSNLRNLFNYLLMRFDEMIILDNYDHLNEEVTNFLNIYTNPKTWIDKRQNLARKKLKPIKNKFKKIVETYKLDILKNELRQKMKSKFEFLITQ